MTQWAGEVLSNPRQKQGRDSSRGHDSVTQGATNASEFDWQFWIAEYGVDPPSVIRAADAARVRGSITREELVRIAYWKSPRAAGKVAYASASRRRDDNMADLRVPDSPHEERTLVRTLTRLPGVSVPLASGILGLVYPARFAVTDRRARVELKQLFAEYPAEETETDYLTTYLPLVRKIAAAHGITPRQVDMALWARNRERHVHDLLEDPAVMLGRLEAAPAVEMRDVTPHVLPPAPGVYVLTRHDGQHRYVGTSENLRQRIYRNHLMGDLQQSAFRREVADRLTTPASREELTRHIREHYHVQWLVIEAGRQDLEDLAK
jgi:hypothetical protein